MSKKETQSGKRSGQTASEELLGPNTEIGRKLRQYYDGLVAEEVPDRFAALLQQLDEVDDSRKAE